MTGNAVGSGDYGFASLPAIKQYLQAAEACGVDCEPILDAANIHPEALQDNNKRLSLQAMERLLALPARVVHGGHFPSFDGRRLRVLIRHFLDAAAAGNY